MNFFAPDLDDVDARCGWLEPAFERVDWNEIASGDVAPSWYDQYGWRYDNSFDEEAYVEQQRCPLPRHLDVPFSTPDSTLEAYWRPENQ